MNSEPEILSLPGAIVRRRQAATTLERSPAPPPLAKKDIALRGTPPDDGRWRATPPRQRALVAVRVAASLREGVEGFARSISSEFGKAMDESRREVNSAAEIIEFHASTPSPAISSGRLLLVCVLARNCGFDQLARLSAPHLVQGDTVMVKHSGSVPKSAATFEQLWHEAGAPRGAFANLVISYD